MLVFRVVGAKDRGRSANLISKLFPAVRDASSRLLGVIGTTTTHGHTLLSPYTLRHSHDDSAVEYSSMTNLPTPFTPRTAGSFFSWPR